MAASKKKSTAKKILKTSGIISAIIFGLFLLISILLLTVLEPYAERFIKKKVSQKTEGLYALDFTDLDINLLSMTVRLNDIHLSFDSTIHQKQKAKKEAGAFLLNLKSEELEVSGIDVLEYLATSNVNIGSILIVQPDAKIIHDTEVPQTKDKKQQNISEIVNSIGIGDFNLKEAEISYFNLNNQEEPIHKIPQLDVRISDFLADSLDQKDLLKMIDLDGFFISLKNQSFVIANDAYTLKFDLFKYDTEERALTIEAFSAIGDHTKMDKPMIAPEVIVPLLKMDKLDLLKAFKTKKLHINELLIDQPFVKLYEIPDLDITVADVYRGLAQFFEITEIDNLNIDQGQVSMYSRENKNVQLHKIDKVDLLLEEVSFDSLSVFDPRENLALQQLTLNIEDYIFTPEKSPYTFTLAQMQMNTKQDYLGFDSLELKADIMKNKQLGYNSGNSSAQLIDFKVPKIQIDGIDMIRGFAQSNLEINKVAILNSNASITKIFKENSSGSDFSAKDIYNSFSFFVKEINIQDFLISNTDFIRYATENKVDKLHYVDQGMLNLRGIHFDSLMAFKGAYKGSPKAPIEDILIEVHKYQYTNKDNSQSFTVGPVKYSSTSEDFSIYDIHFKSFSDGEDKKADSMIIAGKSLSVSNLNIVKAFNKGYLNIEEILVKSPDVFVSRRAKSGESTSEVSNTTKKMPGKEIFEWINPITVKSIKIVDGEAGYAQRVSEATNFQTLEGFSVEIQQLNLRPETIRKAENIIPVENIVIKANNYKFQSPDSIYTLQLDSLFYGSKRKFLTAQYFQLTPDYELHNYRVENVVENAHRNLFQISTDQFKINDFDLIKAYNNDKYAFGEVILRTPELAILQDKNVENDQQKNDSTEQQSEPSKKNSDKTSSNNKDALEKSVQEQIDKYVDIFKIETFRIEDAKFLFEIQKKDSVRESQELDHMSLLIENIKLGDLQASDLTDIFLVDEIDLLLKDYNFILPDSLYELRVNRLKASLAGQYIHIDSVNFEPLFLIDEYADKLDYAQDRFDVSVGDIDLEGINFAEFFNNQNYFVESVLIDGLNTSIYRDSRVEQDPNRRPRTVQQLIKDIPIPLKVDTLKIQNTLLKYSEVSKDGSKPGITTLADTNLQAINITNDSIVYTLKDKMQVKATTRFLGESKLTLDFIFSMNHPEDLYTYEGYLEQMNFKAFNPLLTNLLFVEMESGVIEKIDFSVTATKHRSTGILQFPYENLRFKILNKDNPGNPGFLLKTANWSLNNLLIKTNNPGKLFNNYRRGMIEVERNYSKSVFNHMGNSLLSGFISSTIPEPTKTIIYLFSDLP